METEIYLIGNQITKFVGSKLPSLKEVMSLFFYHHRSRSLTIRQSSLITVENVFELWSKAGIPTCAKNNAIRRLVQQHTFWKNILKNKNSKQSSAQKKKVSLFCTQIKKLFDVAHHKAMKVIDENQKLFLQAQREPNRRGFLNMNLQNTMEVNHSDINDPNVIDDQSSEDDTGLLSQIRESSQSRTSNAISDFDDDVQDPLSLQPKKIDIVTPELAGALDRANVSSRDATYIIAATLASAGLDVNQYNLSHSTVHRKRELARKSSGKLAT